MAYIDRDGCIAWVPLGDGRSGRFCPETRSAVSAITWLDGGVLAFVTPETQRSGWLGLRVATGETFRLTPEESPRIVQVGAPQFYSVRGERLDIVDGVPIWTSADGAERRPLLARPPGSSGFSMVTWAPDGRGVVLAEGPEKALWVVGADGAGARQVAPSSRGVVSWFVPASGAMPHADLTCTLPSESTYRCEPAPWQPGEGAGVTAGGEVVLSWSLCPGATGYEVEVTDATGAVVLRRVTAAPAVRAVFRAPGELTWRVRARIGEALGPWGPARSLTVR